MRLVPFIVFVLPRTVLCLSGCLSYGTHIFVLQLFLLHASSFIHEFPKTFSNKVRQVRLHLSQIHAPDAKRVDIIDEAVFKGIIQRGPIPSADRTYVINGWRWHSLSVSRDIRRFQTLITHLQSNKSLSQEKTSLQLRKCHYFVCTFSWNALLKIEREIFFPWLSENLPIEVTKALLGTLYEKHIEIRGLSSKLESLCYNYKSPSELAEVEACLTSMQSCVNCIQKIQDEIFIPFVSAYVSLSDQDRFNRRVIAKLGLIDSQVHLVSMFEALEEVPAEMLLFKRQIPGIAQALIPVWRQRFYSPMAKYLDLQ